MYNASRIERCFVMIIINVLVSDLQKTELHSETKKLFCYQAVN